MKSLKWIVLIICLITIKAHSQDQIQWETAYSNHGVTIQHHYDIMDSVYKIIQQKKEITLDPLPRADFSQIKIDENSSILKIGYSGGSGTGIAIYRDFIIYINKSKPVLMVDILSGGYTANPWEDPIVHTAGVDDLSVYKNKLHIIYSYGVEEQPQNEYKYSIPMTQTLPKKDECKFIMEAIYGEQ